MVASAWRRGLALVSTGLLLLVSAACHGQPAWVTASAPAVRLRLLGLDYEGPGYECDVLVLSVRRLGPATESALPRRFKIRLCDSPVALGLVGPDWELLDPVPPIGDGYWLRPGAELLYSDAAKLIQREACPPRKAPTKRQMRRAAREVGTGYYVHEPQYDWDDLRSCYVGYVRLISVAAEAPER